MKRIFIYSYNLELGGVERSLIGLLQAIDPTLFHIDLFLAKQEGELINDIPNFVNLLPIDNRYQAFGIPLRDAFKQGFFYEALVRLYAKIVNKLMRTIKRDPTISLESFIYHKLIIKHMVPQDNEYDLAISFAMPYFYVLSKVNANKKIGWIHTDYSKININSRFIRNMFKKIDAVACVSESVKNSLFHAQLNIDQQKCFVFENILIKKDLLKAASASILDFPDDGSIRLLSVGRFCEAKNFDNVPEICSLLRKKGLHVKWYLIGFGGYESLIKQKIKECGMQDYVIVLGKRDNPYPYMANCDLYVQPSRYEGKAVTVREAQMLCKPVVITNYRTSSSQVKDRYDGVIVPLDNVGCANGIFDVWNNKKLIADLVNNCRNTDYSNCDEVNKLFHIMEKE